MKCINLLGLIFGLILLFTGFQSEAQLTVTTSSSAVAMVAKITGSGVSTLNQVLTCDSGVACGTFSVVPGTLMGTGATVFGIDSGILLTTGHATAAAGAEAGTTSFNNGRPGDPTMTALALTATTYDRCELLFDVVPQGDSISFNYIFGSEEYIHSTCGNYDDAFAFFISGPGITGTVNIALIPGTTIPVLVNTVNGGASFVVSGWGTYSNCTSIAPGSPFTAYYTDNTGGANFAYRGYTTKLTAKSAVTACDTYHLKLAIVDAGNGIYDSGVFIEAGSLSSNGYRFDHTAVLGATIGGVPHTIVKGCNPTTVTIHATHANSTAAVIPLTFGGTAANGVDVATVPGSVTMPADSTSVSINISALATPVGGSKVFTIYIGGACGGIQDSISINILDTPSAYILTADTAICAGQSFQIMTTGTSGLTYSWAPGTGLSSAGVSEPIASPTVTTVYTMTATLPGSGCPPIVRAISVTVSHDSVSVITNDTTICSGVSFTINTYATPGSTYNWSPASGLSSATVLNPVASPTVSTTYTVTATHGAGCTATDTLHVTVIPSAITITTPPTTICSGDSVHLNATGLAGMAFSWSPTGSLSNPVISNPVATPTVTTTYTVSGSVSGGACPAVASITITVGNPSVTILTPDTTICAGSSFTMNVLGNAGAVYTWTPSAGLSNAAILEPVVSPTVSTTYHILATVPGTGCAANDSVTVNVITTYLSVFPSDTTICIGKTAQLLVTGAPGMVYVWTPVMEISGNSDIPNPIATPTATTVYTVTGTTAAGACAVSGTVTVNVGNPSVSIQTPDTAICVGKTVTLRGITNAGNVISWAPAATLDNPAAMQPVASPADTTTYYVTVSYPGLSGCSVTDSVTVNILPPLQVIVGSQVMSCNTGIMLQCQPGGLGFSYSWSGPDSFTSTLQNPYIANATSAEQGTYSVVVTDNSNGCIGQNVAAVSIDSTKTSKLTNVTPNTTVPYGSHVHLNADNEVFYWWRPADGTINNPNINNPIVTPVDSVTTYIVYGMDSAGCLDSANVTISLTYGDIGIPTAFTPNGDGLNDIFKPIGVTYQRLVEFRVFNRWGEQLFYSDNIESGWDGTYKGVAQDMDTYFYLMIVAFPNGSYKTYKGDVTLVR
jgi:gliding motility-associated-like protein